MLVVPTGIQLGRRCITTELTAQAKLAYTPNTQKNKCTIEIEQPVVGYIVSKFIHNHRQVELYCKKTGG